jgi:hypothetical protein
MTKFEMVKLNIQWFEWPVTVNWSGRWVKEREMPLNNSHLLQAEVAKAAKPKESAFEMERLAFELTYLREELIRMNVFQQLPSCRTAMGDAAQQLRELAELHREGKSASA